jgi:hypothetical protein
MSKSTTQTKNRLTFLRFDHFKEYTRKGTGYKEKIVYNLYQCSCGRQKVARKLQVNSRSRNSTFSCGCLKQENLKRINDLGLNRHPHIKVKKAHNKGKVCIRINGRNKYVTQEKLKAMYYGVIGEVYPIKRGPPAHNKGKKLINGKYSL